MYPAKHSIRIGTLAGRGLQTAAYIQALIPLGFESFQINFWKTLEKVELPELARELAPITAAAGTPISSLGVFGNPLGDTLEDEETRRCIRQAIECAPLFESDLLCGFAGRVQGRSVPDSIERYREIWAPLAEFAAGKGVRIAFENCPMGGNWSSGDWNIAFNPDAWELMFEALPMENIGLEWEPCHQLCQLIDPIPQLRQWLPKIFHIHGKDANVDHARIARHGIVGPATFSFHRHPGFGDSNWTQIISILRAGGYTGSIDIEGWHDPVYKGDLEMTGQVHALNHLKMARGGDFVPNPAVS